MKLLSFTLIILLLLSGMPPLQAAMPCHEAMHEKEESCHTKKKEHTCCQLPVEEEHEPVEQDPCIDGSCDCHCCILIIAPLTNPIVLYTSSKPEEQKGWHVDMYAFEFAHLIWQPPRVV